MNTLWFIVLCLSREFSCRLWVDDVFVHPHSTDQAVSLAPVPFSILNIPYIIRRISSCIWWQYYWRTRILRFFFITKRLKKSAFCIKVPNTNLVEDDLSHTVWTPNRRHVPLLDVRLAELDVSRRGQTGQKSVGRQVSDGPKSELRINWTQVVMINGI